MNKFFKASLMAAMIAAPAMADESFGGIGVTIYQVKAGVHVAEVIPGGPASETNLQPGDVIIAIDGVSLQNKNIDASKALIRGPVNKPAELTYVSGGDTAQVTVRRTQVTIKNLDSAAVSRKYGNKQAFNAEELEDFANENADNKKLIAVLRRGAVVAEDAVVEASDLNGVYIDKAPEFAPKQAKTAGKSNGAKLRGFTRQTVSFSLRTAGTAVVTVSDASGNQIASARVDNATVGIHTVSWNGETVPAGRYMVSIEQQAGVSGKFAVLK